MVKKYVGGGSNVVNSRERSTQSWSCEDIRLRVEGIPDEPIGHYGGQWLPIDVGDGGAAGLWVEVYRDGVPAEPIANGGTDFLDLRKGTG